MRVAKSHPFKIESLSIKTISRTKGKKTYHYVTLYINDMEFKLAQAGDVSVTNLCEKLFTCKAGIHVRANVDNMKRTYKYLLYLDEEERVVLKPEK